MVDFQGEIIDLFIKINFWEGLMVIEYVIFFYGVCKGLVDMVLWMVDFGYFIWCLVDVFQDVIVWEQDCGIECSLWVIVMIDGDQVKISLVDCLFGCLLVKDVVGLDGEIIVKWNDEIDEVLVNCIVVVIDEVYVRLLLICEVVWFVC